MRRAVLILILAAACASGDPHRNALRIDVSEQRGQRITATGPHFYMVTLNNASQELIAVESIQLAPSGASDFTFEDEMQTVGEDIAPGETRQYQMFVTILPLGRGSAQFTSNIDTVHVTVSCKSNSGVFIDSEVVSITRR